MLQINCVWIVHKLPQIINGLVNMLITLLIISILREKQISFPDKTAYIIHYTLKLFTVMFKGIPITLLVYRCVVIG